MAEMKEDTIQNAINDLDSQMYNLLMKRTELVQQLPQISEVANTLGREAASIRRLLHNHKGDFPEYVIAKIWREILTASAFLNTKLKISLYESQEKNANVVNLVQEHFGSNVVCETYSSFGQVMNALTSGEAQLAVIPCDNHEINQKPWWSAFSAVADKPIHIIAKLPFIHRKDMKEAEEVYVVSLSEADKSGEDITLLSVEVANEVSSSTIIETLEHQGFNKARVLLMNSFDSEEKSCLIEVDGYIQKDDERLKELDSSIKNISIIGAYACPFNL